MVTLTTGCRPLRTRLPERTPSSQKEPVETGSLVSKDTYLRRQPPQLRRFHDAESTSPSLQQPLSAFPTTPLFVSRDTASAHFQEWEDSRSPESRKERGGEPQVSQLRLRLSIPCSLCHTGLGPTPTFTLGWHPILSTPSLGNEGAQQGSL